MLDSPADLTLPRAGSTTARRILGGYLKVCARDLAQIPMGRFPAPLFDGFADARARFLGLLRGPKAGLVYATLRRPAVSVLIRCLHRELWGDGEVHRLDTMLRELTNLLWLELWLADELPSGGVQLSKDTERVYLVGLGLTIELAAGTRLGLMPAQLVFSPGTTTLDRSQLTTLASTPSDALPDVPATIQRVHFPISGGIALVTTDNNPLADQEAHPDKDGNTLDLGGRSAEEWATTLATGFDLVERYYPELAAEMQLVMHAYHPVGFHTERHLSASYAEAIGAAYVSLHPDQMTLTEAIVHEFCHNKINALFAQDALLKNAFEPLFSSPVRPDPRPLYGVLLAVHAFVPVAELYRRMLEADAAQAQAPGFSARHQAIIDKNLEGIATLLTNAETTPTGAWCLAELAEWRDAQHRK
jgi:HEXXH motif-containing protein